MQLAQMDSVPGKMPIQLRLSVTQQRSCPQRYIDDLNTPLTFPYSLGYLFHFVGAFGVFHHILKKQIGKNQRNDCR